VAIRLWQAVCSWLSEVPEPPLTAAVYSFTGTVTRLKRRNPRRDGTPWNYPRGQGPMLLHPWKVRKWPRRGRRSPRKVTTTGTGEKHGNGVAIAQATAVAGQAGQALTKAISPLQWRTGLPDRGRGSEAVVYAALLDVAPRHS
jgi:hypothetical protein